MASTVLAYLPWLLIAAGCWLGYQLVKQNGRILIQLESLNERLTQLSASVHAAAGGTAPEPTGLAVGAAAPAFDLATLDGGRLSLAPYRGRPVLLSFFSPSCGFCQQMAPQLASLRTDGKDGLPIPLVITSGSVDDNRRLFEQHGVKAPIGMQESADLAAAYQVNGTPMGYLIDGEGRIASPLAVGAQALLALATKPIGQAAPAGPPGNGHVAYKGNKPLSESHLNRAGLQPGAPAPDFTLLRLGGGELSLADYRGKRVLLVFSDPGCGPCMQLAPGLEALHRKRHDLEILVVSRGDVDANKAKVQEHHLTYPIVLQRHWEISKAYEMFGTPIGYLIDERGSIAAPPASGAEGILALAAQTATVR